MVGRHLLIAIEGVDGVGKTTVAKAIAEKLNAVYIKTPAWSFLRKVAFFVEKLRSRELEATSYFFLAFISSLYFCVLQTKRHVVCDKYILTTVVDQTVLGSRVARFLKRLRYIIVRKPDFTFCLIVRNESALRGRLQQKERIDHNDLVIVPLWEEIQGEYRRFREVEVIDTTCMSANETIAVLLDRILSRDISIKEPMVL